MIYLITGLPGAGKTLYTIQLVLERAKKEGRQVYSDGLEIVDNVTLPWHPLPKEGWQNLPTGAIIFIDECQRRYRPRGHGLAVPAEVAAFETHRHHGYDIYMTTQQPMLIDSNVRRLVGTHFHIMRKFGAASAIVHEFATGIRDNPDKMRTDSIRHNWPYPKKLYDAYASAEVHTHKFKLPMRVWLMFLIPLVLVPTVYYAGKWFYDSAHGRTMEKAGLGNMVGNTSEGMIHAPVAGGVGGAGGYSSVEDYIKQHTPLLPEVPATAPVYQALVKPTIAPRVSACVASESRCRCYSQQGTLITVNEVFCRGFIEKPVFVDYQEPNSSEGLREGGKATSLDARLGVGSLPKTEAATGRL